MFYAYLSNLALCVLRIYKILNLINFKDCINLQSIVKNLPHIIIFAENHPSFRKARRANVREHSSTTTAFETSVMPVPIQSVKQKPLDYLSPAPRTDFHCGAIIVIIIVYVMSHVRSTLLPTISAKRRMRRHRTHFSSMHVLMVHHMVPIGWVHVVGIVSIVRRRRVWGCEL